eukprot:scaffold35061_cov214-Amphora_coffeaeformis.AAC.1
MYPGHDPPHQTPFPAWKEQQQPAMNEQLHRIRNRQVTQLSVKKSSSSSSTSSSHYELLSSPSLAALWVGDIIMALSVTVAVAPALSAVDKAIVEQSAAGSRNVMLHSMKQTAMSILANPSAYYRSPTFGWMSLTYIATYTTANMIKTWNEQSSLLEDRKRVSRNTQTASATTAAKSTSNGTVLVAATTVANSTASLIKDRAYARMFGQTPRPVPALSYAAWLSRDAFGIGSGFVLPAYVTPRVQEFTGWSHDTSATVSQMGTPVLAQTVAGPLHLAGLTIYNSSANDTLATKLQSFSKNVVSVTVARMLRFLPGYGIAGVMNQKGRTWWKQEVDRRMTGWPLTTTGSSRRTASMEI